MNIDADVEIIMPVSDIPETISIEQVRERKHVARLKDEETDLHSVVFQNEDGTKSLYVFASPVKYVASDGTIRDKSTAITKTATAFTVMNNDAQMSISTLFVDGSALMYNNSSVTMIPLGSSATSIGLLNDNAILYNAAFGNNTIVNVEPLLSGMKHTIVLKAPSGKNSVAYQLDTAGIRSVYSGLDGVINILSTDNETLFKLGIFIVTDANGNVCEGEMQLNINSQGEYIVTAELDELYLQEATYPIMIEASIVVNTSSAINDAIIYSGKPSKAYGAYNYNNIGKVDDSYQVGRLLISFPGLVNNSTYQNLALSQIRKAEYHMYFASGHDDSLTFLAFKQHPNVNWEEYSVTWNYVDNFVDMESINYQLMYLTQTRIDDPSGGSILSINITGTIKKGLSDDSCIQKGLMITNGYEASSSACTDFCSTEYADSHNGNYMPYLTIEYASAGVYIPVNIKIHIDDAFVDRCRVMNVSIQSRLDTLMIDTVAVFRDRFGIQLNYSYVLYETAFDTSSCTNTSISGLCTCYEKCKEMQGDNTVKYHHTNQSYIKTAFPASDTDVCINLLMTGRNTCDHNSDGTCKNGHTVEGVASISSDNIVIYATDTHDPGENSFIQMAILHEIGHLYGVKDHYSENDDMPGSNDICIYGDGMKAVQDSLLICECCTNSINNSLTEYNHS